MLTFFSFETILGGCLKKELHFIFMIYAKQREAHRKMQKHLSQVLQKIAFPVSLLVTLRSRSMGIHFEKVKDHVTTSRECVAIGAREKVEADPYRTTQLNSSILFLSVFLIESSPQTNKTSPC